MVDHMQLVRTHHLDRLEAEIYKPISDLYDSALGDLDFCQRAERKVMRYTMELCHMKGGACKLSDGVLALSMAWTGLVAMARNIAEIEKVPCTGCKNVCNIPMADPVARAAIEGQEEVGGLCLYCEKEGRSPLVRCDHKINV